MMKRLSFWFWGSIIPFILLFSPLPSLSAALQLKWSSDCKGEIYVCVSSYFALLEKEKKLFVEGEGDKRGLVWGIIWGVLLAVLLKKNSGILEDWENRTYQTNKEGWDGAGSFSVFSQWKFLFCWRLINENIIYKTLSIIFNLLNDWH